MAKRTKKARRHSSSFETRMERFGDRMEIVGKKFENRFERINCWCEGFSIMGPLIGALFKTIGFAIVLWIVEFINRFLGISFIASLDQFLLANMGLFFVAFLIFSYISYTVRAFPRLHFFLRPLFFAAGVAMVAWLTKSSIFASQAAYGNTELFQIALYLQNNLSNIFLAVLAVGYIFLAFEIIALSARHEVEKAWKPGNLFRSRKNRIFGGVCGGIAEYLGVDAIFVRILWVLLTLVWGYGILLYLIAWIVMPIEKKRK